MLIKALINIARILAFVVIGIGILIALLIYLFGKAMCGDDQFNKYQSPNQKHEIVNYRRNCGATTTYMYNVELDGKDILRYTYGHPVSVEWIEDKKVSISMASSSPYMQIYKIRNNYRGIQIIFDENITNGYKVN